MNFAKKQSDNLEQQETSPNCSIQSPLERVLSLLRPRAAPTELRALVVEEPEDLETDDEGLISFEEERVRGIPVPLLPPSPVSRPGLALCPGWNSTLGHCPLLGELAVGAWALGTSPWPTPCTAEMGGIQDLVLMFLGSPTTALWPHSHLVHLPGPP